MSRLGGGANSHRAHEDASADTRSDLLAQGLDVEGGARVLAAHRSGIVKRHPGSLQDLIDFLSEFHALRIDLMLHQKGLDTTTPAGKAMFQMMGVFDEFERAMIANG